MSDQFKKIIKRHIKVGYDLDVMRQSACLVLNPITVYSLVLNPITVYIDFLFNCTTVGQASDSLTAVCKALIGGLVPAGSTGSFL